MKKQLIPGTKIVKVIAGKDNNGEKLRKDLEKINIKLLCKGCCKNVYPSGMILNMGTGRKAYTLSYGEQARMNSLVDIFTPCSVDQYATVQQQADFFKSWIKSIGKK